LRIASYGRTSWLGRTGSRVVAARLRPIGRWRYSGGRRRGLRGKPCLQFGVLCRNGIDGGLSIDPHGLVFGLESRELRLDLRPRDAPILQRLLLARYRIQSVAIGRDELALGQIAVD